MCLVPQDLPVQKQDWEKDLPNDDEKPQLEAKLFILKRCCVHKTLNQ